MKALNILMVDDDKTQMPHFKDQLTGLGFAVRHIHDWRVLEEEDLSLCPDVILLDLMMPRHDLGSSATLAGFVTGVSVYENLLALRFPQVPCYVFTAAWVDDREIARALETLKATPGYVRAVSKDSREDLIEELRKIALAA